MVHKEVEQGLKENLHKKVSDKTDSNQCYGNQSSESR